ncbi:aromatic amino acid aminotransferase 2 [Trichomonascus vanleenenianus]|uniref:aromatic amino acid aminotransferase 2 n=1 Tax=Trichomonascus vanleenenianus TaxID=2268995 RepID=UPI003ECAF5E5
MLNGPMDLSHHLGDVAKQRKPSYIKEYYQYLSIPGAVNFVSGLPYSGYFPYRELTARVSEEPGDDGKEESVVVPRRSEESMEYRVDIDSALQYGLGEGYPALRQWVKTLVDTVILPEKPYRDGPDSIMTCGNTDGLTKVVETFSNQWIAGKSLIVQRESIIVEEHTYPAALQTFVPRGLRIVPVKSDKYGMVVNGTNGLRQVLEGWNSFKGRRPHLMYTVTIGQNPTGSVEAYERRKEIYELCSVFDILIIEDEPYWFLQYDLSSGSNRKFADRLARCFLPMDRDGRVIRLDTFSKVIAPGCRLGWVTGQPKLIERILRVTEVATQQPCGFVQSMVAQLVMGGTDPHRNEGWGINGFMAWCEKLCREYERRRDIMCSVLKKRQKDPRSTGGDDWCIIRTELPLYDFDVPAAGMFLWVRIRFEEHPLYGKIAHQDLAKALFKFLLSDPHKVLISLGATFAATDKIAAEEAWKYVRLCFAAIHESSIEASTNKFVDGLDEFWKLETEEDMSVAIASVDH